MQATVLPHICDMELYGSYFICNQLNLDDCHYIIGFIGAWKKDCLPKMVDLLTWDRVLRQHQPTLIHLGQSKSPGRLIQGWRPITHLVFSLSSDELKLANPDLNSFWLWPISRSVEIMVETHNRIDNFLIYPISNSIHFWSDQIQLQLQLTRRLL